MLIALTQVGSEHIFVLYTAPKMQCTMNKIINSSDSGSFCDQWQSKRKYYSLAIGGDTKFELLYIDFKIFGDRFANELLEGGVRPPNLIQAGITQENNHAVGNNIISIQWDIGLYQGEVLSPRYQVKKDFLFNISSEEQIEFCPGMASNFWISVYNELSWENFITDTLILSQIIFIDETQRRYTFNNFCQENGTWRYIWWDNGTCSDPNLPGYFNAMKDIRADDPQPDIVIVGGRGRCPVFGLPSPDLGCALPGTLVPMFIPDCIYDYPDVVSNATVQTLAGTLQLFLMKLIETNILINRNVTQPNRIYVEP